MTVVGLVGVFRWKTIMWPLVDWVESESEFESSSMSIRKDDEEMMIDIGVRSEEEVDIFVGGIEGQRKGKVLRGGG